MCFTWHSFSHWYRLTNFSTQMSMPTFWREITETLLSIDLILLIRLVNFDIAYPRSVNFIIVCPTLLLNHYTRNFFRVLTKWSLVAALVLYLCFIWTWLWLPERGTTRKNFSGVWKKNFNELVFLPLWGLLALLLKCFMCGFSTCLINAIKIRMDSNVLL